MKTRLYHERGEGCEVCPKDVPRETIEIHHVMHQAQHPDMRMDEENCVLICRTCHALDDRGLLRPLLIRQRGQQWLDNLRAKARA